MPTFEHTIEIAAPVDQVYEFGNDPENWERVMSSLSVENVEETEAGLRMDTTYRMLGIATSGEMVHTIIEPRAHTVASFESPGMTGELHYEYEETDDGTNVVQRADYKFGDSLLQRVVEPVASRYNRRQFKNALKTSKELIEATEMAATA